MKMTITRALAEIKLLDARINKQTTAAIFIDCKTNKLKATAFRHLDPESLKQTAKSDFESIITLIENRRKIKSAIMAANAATIVKIAGSNYSVAEAIEKKASIEYTKKLLLVMKEQQAKITQHATKHNSTIENQISEMLKANLATADKKPSEEDYEMVGKPFRAAHEMVIIDPLDLQKKIKEVEEGIEEFEKEVDFILSESNSRTEIEA